MKDNFQHLKKGAFVLMAMVCSSGLAQGQNYDSIAIKYKNENAVITNYTNRLEISFEDGKPVGKSSVTEERLLISDLAPSMYNQEAFHHNSKFNVMEDMDAWTYTPTKKDGYKKTPVYAIGDVRTPDDQTFYSDSWLRVVSYTGLVKGSRTVVKYIVNHTDGHMLPSEIFQHSLPVISQKFEVVAPKYVTMNFVLKGEHTGDIVQSRSEANGMVTYTFTAANLPAYEIYPGVPSVWYYFPQVIPYITSYKHFNEDKPKEWLANADELYKHYYKSISHVNMNEDTSLNRIVKELTKNDKTQREKAAHIYNWVQKNMHYIAFEDGLEGFVPREAKVICDRKYGDCKDMASILTAMCRKAGMQAYFTWIGTRHLPYTYEETPLPSSDNHMISTVKIGDEWIFMDGTHPLIPFGANPEGIQGKQALVGIDAKNYKILTVPEAPADNNFTNDSSFISLDGSTVKGYMKLDFTGYPAWGAGDAMRYLKKEDKEKFFKRTLERGSDRYQQSKLKAVTLDSINKDVRVTADFVVEDYVTTAGKQYYINMNLNRAFENKHIKTKDRSVSYYFDYKEKKKEVVVLNIPKGYKVTYVPPAVHGKANGLWSYDISYTVSKDKKTITLVKQYTLDTLSIDQAKFAESNKMVDALKKAYRESIVLTAPKA